MSVDNFEEIILEWLYEPTRKQKSEILITLLQASFMNPISKFLLF